MNLLVKDAKKMNLVLFLCINWIIYNEKSQVLLSLPSKENFCKSNSKILEECSFSISRILQVNCCIFCLSAAANVMYSFILLSS